jgi:hypothetical protein
MTQQEEFLGKLTNVRRAHVRVHSSKRIKLGRDSHYRARPCEPLRNWNREEVKFHMPFPKR